MARGICDAMQRVKVTVELPDWALAWVRRREGELSDSIDALLRTHVVGKVTKEATDKVLARGERVRVTINVDPIIKQRATLRKMSLSDWLSERLAIGWLLSQTDYSLTGKFQAQIAKEMREGLGKRDTEILNRKTKGKAPL